MKDTKDKLYHNPISPTRPITRISVFLLGKSLFLRLYLTKFEYFIDLHIVVLLNSIDLGIIINTKFGSFRFANL